MTGRGGIEKIKRLECGKIMAEKDYDSDVSLIIVGEYHYKKDVQLDVFNILTELKKYTSFDLLLLENLGYGEMDWEGFPHDIKDYDGLKKYYGDLNVDLRPDEILRGGIYFGYLNSKDVRTGGVEIERHLNYEEFHSKDERCKELSLRQYNGGPQALTKDEHRELESLIEFVRETIVKKASYDFVDTSLKVMRKLGKDLAVFDVGDMHMPAMIERLDHLGISYKCIVPDSLDNYSTPVEFYLIERKPDDST